MPRNQLSKLYGIKFVLWAVESIGWDPKSSQWDGERMQAEILARAKTFTDEKMAPTEAELIRAIELVEAYLEDS